MPFSAVNGIGIKDILYQTLNVSTITSWTTPASVQQSMAFHRILHSKQWQVQTEWRFKGTVFQSH